jgi:hypothetical protein
MSEFLPPTTPPPPKVPEGWKAVWNDQYKEWYAQLLDPLETRNAD